MNTGYPFIKQAGDDIALKRLYFMGTAPINNDSTSMSISWRLCNVSKFYCGSAIMTDMMTNHMPNGIENQPVIIQ